MSAVFFYEHYAPRVRDAKMHRGMISAGGHSELDIAGGEHAGIARPTTRMTLIAVVIAVTATVAALSGALGNGFVWDDFPNLVANHEYRSLSGSSLLWMFTTTHGGHYQPLSWLSFAVDHTLWGSEDAFGFHLTNLCLHALAVGGVFFVARRLSPATGGAAIVGALTAALLFGVHPLRVESVAWATERRDVLSGVFLVVTVLCYLRAHDSGAKTPRIRYLALAVAAYVLSLLSKATGMTLPVVLLILDVYPLRRLRSHPDGAALWPVLREKLLFAVPAVVVAGMALHAQARAGALWTSAEHPYSLRIAQALYGLAFYPWKTVCPTNLVPLYEQNPAAALLDTANIVGAVVVVLLTAGAWAMRRRAPACLTAWASYVVLVSPMLGLAQSGPQVVADRYSYVACLPFAILLGGGLSLLWARLGTTGRRLQGVAAAGVAVICLLLMMGTRQQVRMWRDPLTLWTTTLARAPQTPTAHANLAALYLNRGEYELARRHAEAALERLPGNRSAHVSLAQASLELGDATTAERSFRIALGIAKTLGREDTVSEAGLAASLMRQKRFSEAESLYRSLVQLHPEVAAWYVNLAGTLAAQDRKDAALAALSRAIDVDPGFVPTYLRLATLYLDAGDPATAIASLERGLRAVPDDVNLLARLAWVLATVPDDTLRDGPRAVELASRAETLSGGKSILAVEALAAAHAETGDFAAATRLIESLLAASPAALSSETLERLQAAYDAYAAHRPWRE